MATIELALNSPASHCETFEMELLAVKTPSGVGLILDAPRGVIRIALTRTEVRSIARKLVPADRPITTVELT